MRDPVTNSNHPGITTSVIFSLSNFEIRRDVTRFRLSILGELPLNECIVYGIAAQHARCMVTRLKYAIYRACDITSNLEVGHNIFINLHTYIVAWWTDEIVIPYLSQCIFLFESSKFFRIRFIELKVHQSLVGDLGILVSLIILFKTLNINKYC